MINNNDNYINNMDGNCNQVFALPRFPGIYYEIILI